MAKLKSTYRDYVSSLKKIVEVSESKHFPRLILMYGSSDFLRMRGIQALQKKWSQLQEDAYFSIEGSSLDQRSFQALWSQVSLMEPECLYVLKRCDKVSKLGQWLKDIKASKQIRCRMVIELGEKIPVELEKQVLRLEGEFLACHEPTGASEFSSILSSFAKKEGVQLSDDARNLLLNSMGLDLSKLDNEVRKLGLAFAGRKEALQAADIAPVIGHLREDHVFELFSLLRSGKTAAAQLLVDQLLDRGEKAVALVGIFSRYARELMPRNAERAILALQQCAAVDQKLKSSGISESLLLAQLINAE